MMNLHIGCSGSLAGTNHMPLTIDGATVERVSNIKFLGMHLADELTSIINI